jgi:GT2 family glycosyltransferase
MTARPSTGAESIVDSRNGVSPASAELSIIIVNWNSKDFVRRCLQSLYQHCSETPFEVVVVDNGSFDGSARMIAHEFPRAIYVQSVANIGFARANNLGVRHSSGRDLLFLNPDTELLENSVDTLRRRLATLPGAGAVGCKLINEDRTLQGSCVQSFPTIFNQMVDSDFLRARFPRWRIWGTKPLHADISEPAAVEVISGACILIKRDVFERIGGFTEEYFMYGEDLDLCFKVKLVGLRVYYLPQTSIIHHGGGSTKRSDNNLADVLMRESVYRFMQTNRGLARGACYRLAMLMASVARILLILPMFALSRGDFVSTGTQVLQKWFAILRWSLGSKFWKCRQLSCPEENIIKQTALR